MENRKALMSMGKYLLGAALLFFTGSTAIALGQAAENETQRQSEMIVAYIDRPADADKVFAIWPGDGLPPDTAHWERREQISTLSSGLRIVRNVAVPSLTMFSPDPEAANGTAIVIAPGGAFHFLAIDHEGYDVARWLVSRGVTAFVLKYRVQEMPADESALPAFMEDLGRKLPSVAQDTVDPPQAYPPAEEARVWAEADIAQAVQYLRNNAVALGLAPDRIGVIGFSAGGAGVNVAASHDASSRPNFIAGIYPGWRRPLDVQSDAPPLFIAIGDEDTAVAPISAARLYEEWHTAGASAELHIFPESNHGFGMRQNSAPSDAWTELFEAWLTTTGNL